MKPDYCIWRNQHWCGWKYVTCTIVDGDVLRPGVALILCCPAWWSRRRDDLTVDFWKGVDEMKRAQQNAQKSKGKYQHPDDPFLAEMPHLAQHLCDSWWDDGKPREVCTLTIRIGDKQANLSLNDIGEERSVSTTAETVREALVLLDDALGTERANWRSWKRKK